jgi:CHAD domain-containing protein
MYLEARRFVSGYSHSKEEELELFKNITESLDMKDIQEYLGDIQDSHVLEVVMTNVLESDIKSVLPTFAQVLAQSRYKAWQKWQLFQRRYLNTELRLNFRSTLLHPIVDLTLHSEE